MVFIDTCSNKSNVFNSINFQTDFLTVLQYLLYYVTYIKENRNLRKEGRWLNNMTI